MSSLGPLVVTAAALGVVVLAVGLVVIQPRNAWRDAAEHSRLFWVAWAGSSVVIGALPIVNGLGWGEVAWFAAWCVFAAFQPAMITDIRDVHRHTSMGVRARLASRRAEVRAVLVEERAEAWASDQPRPISWRAPRDP